MTLNGRIHKLSIEEKMRLLQPIAKLSMEIDPYYVRQKRRPRTLVSENIIRYVTRMDRSPA